MFGMCSRNRDVLESQYDWISFLILCKVFISFIFTRYFLVQFSLTTLVVNPGYSFLHLYIKQVKAELLCLGKRKVCRQDSKSKRVQSGERRCISYNS